LTVKLTPEELTERFVKEMLRLVPETKTFKDRTSIEKYARETAPIYYDEQYAEDPSLTPEELAEADISYWEYLNPHQIMPLRMSQWAGSFAGMCLSSCVA
jgi:hypothetical protein